MGLIDSAVIADLFVPLARRRRGWLEPLIDLLTDSAAWWLPGPWWWYVVGIPVGIVALRVVAGWVAALFH